MYSEELSERRIKKQQKTPRASRKCRTQLNEPKISTRGNTRRRRGEKGAEKNIQGNDG